MPEDMDTSELGSKIQTATENLKTAQHHQERVEKLSKEIEEIVEKKVESAINFDSRITTSYSDENEVVTVKIYPDEIIEEIKDQLNNNLEASITSPLQIAIGDDVELDLGHRDRIKNLKHLIDDLEEEYDEGAPVDVVVSQAEAIGMDRSKVEHEVEKLKQKGEVYEPKTDHLRTT